ncbi:MAG: hypothetical protein AAFP84_12495, partial [Actinomycetota bacterium]
TQRLRTFRERADDRARIGLNVLMASKTKRVATGSAVTESKGHATARRGESAGRSSRISPTMEWVIAGAVLLAVIIGLFLLFGDVRSNVFGGHGGGGTAPVVETVVVDELAA